MRITSAGSLQGIRSISWCSLAPLPLDLPSGARKKVRAPLQLGPGHRQLNRTQETGQVHVQGHPPLEGDRQELVLFIGTRAKGSALLLKWGEFAIHSEDNKAR